jgi:hypothetical protein
MALFKKKPEEVSWSGEKRPSVDDDVADYMASRGSPCDHKKGSQQVKDTRKLHGSTITEYHCSACGQDYEVFS